MGSAPIEWLRAKGADDIAHLNGTLLQHLEGTAALLRDWDASADVINAGLCHASYGTDGFAPSLLPLTARPELVEVIGEPAEASVYFYASCDRGFVYPQFSAGGTTRFRDRFTGDEYAPTEEQLRTFVEVTYANELELLPDMPDPDAAAAADFFESMQAYATPAAVAAAEAVIAAMKVRS